MNSPFISWDDQRAFLAVLETGSLSAAARRLGLTQPTVRNRIEALEHAVGGALFTRSVNGLVPTDQARELGTHARAMELASDAFLRAASSPPGEIAGTVRLSVSDFIGAVVLPRLLVGLRETHPGLRIEVDLSNTLADMLGQQADIAVRMDPPRQDALVAKHVGAIPLGFYAHRDYVARRGSPADLAELASHDLIGPDRDRANLAFVKSLAPDLARNAFVFRTDSHPAAFAAVRAGLGIGVVQRPVAALEPDLVPIMPDFDVAELPTWIVTHEDLRRVPRVRAVFDHLVKAFGNYCAG